MKNLTNYSHFLRYPIKAIALTLVLFFSLQVKAQTPNNGDYNIKINAGTQPGETFLSCRADGFVDLYSHDDNSGRQKWKLVKLENGNYNIKIVGGTNQGETFLSCRADGFVDLYSHDDNSGRQQWKIVPIGRGIYNVLIAGGTNSGEKYLSCRADGFVDLYSHDDASGRQRWKMSSLNKGRVTNPTSTTPGRGTVNGGGRR
jgi:hypothetical protein